MIVDQVQIITNRETALRLCARAGILTSDDGINGLEVPDGGLYDTVADRLTFTLDEAATWATERLATCPANS